MKLSIALCTLLVGSAAAWSSMSMKAGALSNENERKRFFIHGDIGLTVVQAEL